MCSSLMVRRGVHTERKEITMTSEEQERRDYLIELIDRILSKGENDRPHILRPRVPRTSEVTCIAVPAPSL